MPVLYRRADNTYVIEKGGYPYHVIQSDPLYYEMLAEAMTAPLEEPPPPPPPAVPKVISDRQFFQLLAMRGIITEAEALAAVGPGVIPAQMQAFIAQLPGDDERFAATMLLTGATQFERAHPLVPVFAQLFGWSDADLDQFWIEAGAL